MTVSNISFMGSYLEYLPLNKIVKYTEGPPKNGIAFTGYPQQHPAEKTKLILVYEPLGETPLILEFKIEDVLFVEDLPQVVTENGENIRLVKLWIRKGAHGMLLEPFEVDESVRFIELRREQKERFTKQGPGDKFSAGSARL